MYLNDNLVRAMRAEKVLACIVRQARIAANESFSCTLTVSDDDESGFYHGDDGETEIRLPNSESAPNWGDVVAALYNEMFMVAGLDMGN